MKAELAMNVISIVNIEDIGDLFFVKQYIVRALTNLFSNSLYAFKEKMETSGHDYAPEMEVSLFKKK